MADERDKVERRYVAALMALDAAAEPSPVVRESAAAAAADLVRLNQAWNPADPPHAGAPRPGAMARLLNEVRRLLPWRRRRVHGAMIAAINRNVETTRALMDATQHFHSHVVWYAQTIAALAAAPRRGDPTEEGLEMLRRGYEVMSTDWLKHWESLGVREERYEARMQALTKAYNDLREVANLAQQGTTALKRTVEGLSGGAAPVAPRGTTDSATAPATAPSSAPAPPDTNAFKYVGFEDRFRGSREDVRERLRPYVDMLASHPPVLDAGCGRGELLELLRERGVTARGVDGNAQMAADCRARGLAVEHADALAYLLSQPDASLGGITAIQVVEHFTPDYLMRFLDAAHRKLVPGGVLIAETINPACWAAFFDSYIRDLTHVQPLHPDTLKYVVQASGFPTAEVMLLSPVAEQDRLPTVRLSTPSDTPRAILDLVEALNAHADRLNSQLFTYRDYAIVARK